jgi:hypothetical protein
MKTITTSPKILVLGHKRHGLVTFNVFNIFIYKDIYGNDKHLHSNRP